MMRTRDEAFRDALDKLQAQIAAQPALDERFAEMREALGRIEAMVRANIAELQAMREPYK
jgi:hypothetical protein